MKGSLDFQGTSKGVWPRCSGHTRPVPSPCPLLVPWAPALRGMGHGTCQKGKGGGCQPWFHTLTGQLLHKSILMAKAVSCGALALNPW